MKRLQYLASTGDLTFVSNGQRRTVPAGARFDVDDGLATTLMDFDQNVVEVTKVDTKESVAPNASAPKRSELIAQAKALGIPANGTNAALLEAIVAAEDQLAAEAEAEAAAADATQGGSDSPADDPDASATGEAGAPPSTGVVVTGDLPDSAKLAK